MGADERAADGHGDANAVLRQAGLHYLQERSRIRPDVPDHRHSDRAGGPAVASGIAGVPAKPYDQRSAAARRRSSRTCRRSGPRSPVPRWWRSSSRRCRARPACRCSSSSPPRSPWQLEHVAVQAVMTKARADHNSITSTPTSRSISRNPPVVDNDKTAALGITKQQGGHRPGRRWAVAMSTISPSMGALYQVILQKDRGRTRSDALEALRHPHCGRPGHGGEHDRASRYQRRAGIDLAFPAIESGHHFRRGYWSQDEALAYLRTTLQQVSPPVIRPTMRANSCQYIKESGGFLGSPCCSR